MIIINDMVVRSTTVGATAAYGVVLAAKEFLKEDRKDFFKKMDKALDELNVSRPTAVNLMWAIGRMRNIIEENKELTIEEIYQKIREEADLIYKEDLETNKAMAKHGNQIIKEGATF